MVDKLTPEREVGMVADWPVLLVNEKLSDESLKRLHRYTEECMAVRDRLLRQRDRARAELDRETAAWFLKCTRIARLKERLRHWCRLAQAAVDTCGDTADERDQARRDAVEASNMWDDWGYDSALDALRDRINAYRKALK